jgi:hypothetical protein
MKTLLKSIIALAVIAGNVGGAASAKPGGRQEKVIIFWDSEDHNTIMGQHVYFCDGSQAHVGTATLYDEEVYYGCD